MILLATGICGSCLLVLQIGVPSAEKLPDKVRFGQAMTGDLSSASRRLCVPSLTPSP
jgi:hypothetical protein